MEFKDRLAEFLKKNGITQQQFAQDCGLSRAAVSRYLSGERQPSYSALLQMRRHLGNWSELLG